MFTGGTKKKDKKIMNSIFSMDDIFDENINNNININTSKNNNNIININNSNNKSTNSDSQNSDNDNLFGFENIEAPKEEEFGDFRIIISSTFTSKVSKELSKSKTFQNNVDLLNLIIVNKNNKIKKKLPNLKSYITSIYYTKNNTKDKFNKKTFKSPCQIYDTITKEIISNSDINFSKNSFIYMSYRSDFENLCNLGCGNFTSDCGWGCMLRCCQMMLSRGIIKKELYNDKNITSANILELKKEVLALFSDKFILIRKLKNNKFLSHFYEKYKSKQDVYELIPPYSIYTLCKLNNSAGSYTSDMKMIKSFIEINRQVFNDEYKIVHFGDGTISRQKLLETFCIKRNLLEKENEYKNIKINPMTNNQELNEINNINIEDPINTINVFDYFGVEYCFAKGGFVFISFRLGLRDLDENYYDFIPLLFTKFHNNIGFVSGKRNKAFYFIGFNGDNKLIYADPHLNQKADNDDISSYEIKDLYLLKIKDLSSGITIGININNSTDFQMLISDLQWFNKNYSMIIKFK